MSLRQFALQSYSLKFIENSGIFAFQKFKYSAEYATFINASNHILHYNSTIPPRINNTHNRNITITIANGIIAKAYVYGLARVGNEMPLCNQMGLIDHRLENVRGSTLLCADALAEIDPLLEH